MPEYVQYRTSPTAWMTAELFVDYLKWFDKEMELQNIGRALLVLDNAPMHIAPSSLRLLCTTIDFLHPNITRVKQPMDAGIIRSFKAHYRAGLCRELLALEVLGSSKWNIDFGQCIKLTAYAWSKVSNNTIKNCFKHLSFDLA